MRYIRGDDHPEDQKLFVVVQKALNSLLEDDSSEVPVMPSPSEELEDGDYVVSDEDEDNKAVAVFDEDEDEAIADFHED